MRRGSPAPRRRLSARGTVHTVVRRRHASRIRSARRPMPRSRHTDRIDILVNNAGIAGVTKKTWEIPPDGLAGRAAGQSVRRVSLLPRHVPHMMTRRYGRIVNIASIAGKEGNPNASHYSAAKGGVIALTKSLGKELAREGIARQLHRSGGDRDRDPEASHPGAHRLHAVEDSDEPIWEEGRGRGARRLALVRGVFLQHRRGVRPLGRPRDVTSQVAACEIGEIGVDRVGGREEQLAH